MKFDRILGYLLVGASMLGLASTHSEEIEKQQLQHIEQSSAFEILQDFREPKKVLFASLMGGSSHMHWVISILNELDLRGHDTHFITMVR